MEENDGNMVRIRLSFDDRHLLHKSQRSQGLRRCWLLLKRDITNIGDLASQISECFGLRHRIVLLMDDFVLPSFESTRLITDKDIIRVKKKEAKQKDISKPCEGQNLSQDYENARVHDLDFNKNHLVDGKPQENLQGNGSYDKDILTSCMKNSINLGPPGDNGSSKRKRKHSKKLLDSKGQSNEMNHDNEFEPENNSDVNKKKQTRFQMVPHSSGGEEDAIASEVLPDCIRFQSREHGTQEPDEMQANMLTFQKPLLFDGGSNIKEPYNKEDTFPETTNNDQCFKVDSAPIFEGILSLPKSEVISSAVDITKPCKHGIHFEILLPLRRLPMKGDILAYRYVESSSFVHSQLSSPKIGEVSSFDYKTLQIILLPVLDYVFVLDENLHGIVGQPNASLYKEDGSLEIEYLSLVDVRLVKAHDPEEEKASQDDHARKDNWEEALLKGNWNEPNASAAEQSNSWAQWIPNKSATTMPWSFKQPNAPFAGRGTGRTNWASNRSMNNRIPNMNTTNWNPNRNNAARNPNKSNIRFTAIDNTATLPWSYRASGLPNPWEHHQNN